MKMIDELKIERTKLGLDQRTVAEAMGTSQSALSRAERNGNPTQDFLQRYQQALRCLTHPKSNLELATIKIIVSSVARKYGIAEVFLYGSAARGEADDESDVDLLYRCVPSVCLSARKLSQCRAELESIFSRNVSLTSFDTILHRAQNSVSGKLFYEHIKHDLIKVA